MSPRKSHSHYKSYKRQNIRIITCDSCSSKTKLHEPCLDPDMLNVNIALKGIPSCLCEDDDDDVDSICSCSTCLTDVESSIAEHNIIAKLVPPAQLEKSKFIL